jgi:hypothetical protein
MTTPVLTKRATQGGQRDENDVFVRYMTRQPDENHADEEVLFVLFAIEYIYSTRVPSNEQDFLYFALTDFFNATPAMIMGGVTAETSVYAGTIQATMDTAQFNEGQYISMYAIQYVTYRALRHNSDHVRTLALRLKDALFGKTFVDHQKKFSAKLGQTELARSSAINILARIAADSLTVDSKTTIDRYELYFRDTRLFLRFDIKQ